MTNHTITLEKVVPPFADGDWFSRGERAIHVDGVRWGRTHVRSHGPRGYSVRFSQDEGDAIYRAGVPFADQRDWNRISVSRPARWKREEPARTMDQIVLGRIVQLIADGQLRHPDAVRAEHRAASEKYRRERLEEKMQLDEAFRQKAMQACGINDPESDMVARVVEAMRWAQSQ